MSQFIKKSLEELEHVVWPTNVESKKYMIYTVGTIIVMATLLSVVGYIIQQWLKWVRDQFPHTAIVNESVSGEQNVTEADIENLRKEAERKRNALSWAKIEINGSGTTNDVQAEILTGTGK